jgi:hypothetical protein
VALFRIAVRLLSGGGGDRMAEELVFKSINLMWKLDKEILDTCCEGISECIVKLLMEHAGNVQTPIG